MTYFQKSLELYIQLGEKKGIVRNLNNIGVIYFQLFEYYKSLEYYNKALDINVELNNKRAIGITLGMIATLYHKL